MMSSKLSIEKTLSSNALGNTFERNHRFTILYVARAKIHQTLAAITYHKLRKI